MKKLHVILFGTILCASLIPAQKSLASLLDTDIEKEINEFEQFKAPETNVQMQETEKHVEINIALPEFKKEDITVTIEDKTEKETNKKCLMITAKKTAPEKDKEKKDAQIKTHQEFSSFKSINGQEQSIQYKNGHIKISIDLPEYASVNADYEMEFTDNKLIIKFPKITKKDKKKLTFTK